MSVAKCNSRFVKKTQYTRRKNAIRSEVKSLGGFKNSFYPNKVPQCEINWLLFLTSNIVSAEKYNLFMKKTLRNSSATKIHQSILNWNGSDTVTIQLCALLIV